MVKKLFASALVVAALACAAGPASASFMSMTVFGDDLSDTGNVFAATGGAVPAPPYFAGRFSNGPIWIDHLSTALALPSGAVAALSGGNNYAFGGARTGTDTSPAPGLLAQIGGLWAPTHPTADPNGLYVVAGGFNDMRDAASNPANAATIANQAAANMGTALALLYSKGARSFFVPNLYNLGRTPGAIASGNPAAATVLSSLFNSLLATRLDEFAATRPDAILYRFDTFAFLDDVITNAAAYGFTNTTSACILTAGCNPDEFIFWDNFNPTARTHELLGVAMAESISAAVPEPSTLAILSLGLAGLAATRRRKQ